jgi:hypothetical protein
MDDEGVSRRLSAQDLLDAVPGSVFYRYPDLRKFANVDALLDTSPIHVCFILYLVDNANSGHWTCLFRRDDGVIEFFDPYGLCVDSELGWVQADKRVALHEDTPVLLGLLVKGSQEERWVFNKYDFQASDARIQTCGRWCALRAVHKDMDDKAFHALIKTSAKRFGGDFDEAAVALTDPLLHP